MFMLWVLSCTTEEKRVQFSLGRQEGWGQTGVLRSGRSSSTYIEGSLEYSAEQAADGNHKSSWCAEKRDGNAWVQITSPCHGDLLGVMIRNGFAESRISFAQRDRVHKAELELEVDGTVRWKESIELHDTIQIQNWDMKNEACSDSYSLTLTIQERYEDVGMVCVSELQAMVSDQDELQIVQGDVDSSMEVPARVTLEVYAGPSPKHTLIGYAPILLTRYGAPYVRVVEERGDFFRFDRLRRRFTPEESPPLLDDPSSGGWVHRSQLDWDLSY
jgi:hypothetical protein